MEKRINPFVYWLPRILGILLILFLALFSLDVFDMAATPVELMTGLLIHNIPSFVLILILVISWRWELVGGIIYPLLGLTYSLTNPAEHWSAHLVISAPLILTGLLFLVCWNAKRKTVLASQTR